MQNCRSSWNGQVGSCNKVTNSLSKLPAMVPTTAIHLQPSITMYAYLFNLVTLCTSVLPQTVRTKLFRIFHLPHSSDTLRHNWCSSCPCQTDPPLRGTKLVLIPQQIRQHAAAQVLCVVPMGQKKKLLKSDPRGCWILHLSEFVIFYRYLIYYKLYVYQIESFSSTFSMTNIKL